MRIFRFMSSAEFRNYLNGQSIEGKFVKGKACFLEENIPAREKEPNVRELTDLTSLNFASTTFEGQMKELSGLISPTFENGNFEGQLKEFKHLTLADFMRDVREDATAEVLVEFETTDAFELECDKLIMAYKKHLIQEIQAKGYSMETLQCVSYKVDLLNGFKNGVGVDTIPPKAFEGVQQTLDDLENEENKKRIYEHIQSTIGYYTEYQNEIQNFYANGILDKELATRVLANLVYMCKTTKYGLKPDEEFKSEKIEADKLFRQIPKAKDFHEDGELVYVRESDGEEYDGMSDEDISSNICKALLVEETYKKISSIQNLRERANSALQSISSINEHKSDVPKEQQETLTQLGDELKELLGKTKTDINVIQNIIQKYNKVASEIWKGYLTNDAEQPRWLVHNLSRGSFEGDFNKKYMSSSLITSKTMGLFSENMGNNFGFIIKPTNIVSSSERDSFTNNSPVNKYMKAFSRGKNSTNQTAMGNRTKLYYTDNRK